ncbi:MAG: nicotinate phosphoribosyltransferase [Aquificaceae bacterium]
MKVFEYIQQTGLKNLVDQAPEGYEELGRCQNGCHFVAFYVKMDGDKVSDIKAKVSKRCKKLMALADYMAGLMKERGLRIDEEEVINLFKEEREIDKIRERLNMIKEALAPPA